MVTAAGRPVAPARKLVGAVTGTFATFMVLFGLGMRSWAIVALGVALLALAIALATIRAGGRAWVVGTATVQQATEPPAAYSHGRCELEIVVDAPGLPPRSRRMIEPRVPIAKWPVAGQLLPVKVALDDHRRIRILWDEVPTHEEAPLAGAVDGTPAAGTDTLVAEFGAPLDELLIGEKPAPWRNRPEDDDFAYPSREGELVTDDLAGDVAQVQEERPPVVMHETTGGITVVEGTLVDAPAPAPRRPSPSPASADPGPAADGPAAAPGAPGTTAQSRTEGPAQSGAASAADRSTPIVDPIDIPLDPEPDIAPPVADTSVDPVAGERLYDAPILDDLFGAVPAEPLREGPGISGVGVTLLVTDLARAVDFYTDLIGLYEIDGGDNSAVLASGANRLVLREVAEATGNRRLTHINLEVADLAAAHQRLSEQGLGFTSPPQIINRGTRFDVWAATFRDPDGNSVALTEWREHPAD